MVKIQYPAHHFKLKKENDREMIFDELRKTWLKLTPEEWVRQNFIRYLADSMKYPSSLIALEKKVMVGEMTKRFDILVYNKRHEPWMMIECKSPDISLKENVLAQVLRYNIALPVIYLVITNGLQCMVFEKRSAQLIEKDELPQFEQ
jgi:hypothetical protein